MSSYNLSKGQSSNQRISKVLHVAKIIYMLAAHVEDSYSYQWKTGTADLTLLQQHEGSDFWCKNSHLSG